MRGRVVLHLRLEGRQDKRQDLLRLREPVRQTAAHVLDILVDIPRQRVKARDIIFVVLLGAERRGAHHIGEVGVKAGVGEEWNAPPLEFGKGDLMFKNERQKVRAEGVVRVERVAIHSLEAGEEIVRDISPARKVRRRNAGDFVIVQFDAGLGRRERIFLHRGRPVIFKKRV